MSDDNFWPCLNDMVGILAGSREESEQTLDGLEDELFRFPIGKRAELRNDIMIVVAQLGRLATRINEMESGTKSRTQTNRVGAIFD
jgi:hypothetical protein